ncbi:DUF4179 domain-containing protein [Gottfriedia sp. NPDC058432]|uniref:DUF4179 domain-containing protein n=1 Tax=Gottfriedia sp. NPDC058432 TaxID=3346497 RepID=UPI003666ADCE
MFEKEENELKKLKEKYENIGLPIDEIDEAIQIGFQKAKETKLVTKPRRKSKIWSIVAAAILLLGFLTSIRVSPTFADYLTNIPGMEKIVKLIRDDKGLISAVENKYAQEINISQEKSGIKVTIDSVIADEQGIVIFYTIDAKETQHNFTLKEVSLKPSNGEKLPEHSSSFDLPVEDELNTYTSKIEYFFQKTNVQKDFNLDLKIKSKEVSEQFSIQFSLKNLEKTKQIYELNKTVTIEGQKITIKKVTVYPLRVAVQVKMDPNNTKKILDFTDFELLDQNGEVWSKITNGTTANILSDNERIIYLQSNYFKDPKELYLVINKLQAVDKDEEYILVDTEKQQILKQPKGNYLTDLKKEESELKFTLNTKKEFHYSLVESIFDANGKVVQTSSESQEYDDGGKQVVGITISTKDYVNPLKLKLAFYPEYIQGDAKIRIK